MAATSTRALVVLQLYCATNLMIMMMMMMMMMRRMTMTMTMTNAWIWVVGKLSREL